MYFKLMFVPYQGHNGDFIYQDWKFYHQSRLKGMLLLKVNE